MIIKEKNTLIILIIIFFGIFFRIYNLNFENLWHDEILSFWIADPSISFFETLDRHNELEQVPILFNLILKYFYKVFGYNVYLGRYLSCFFGIISLFICYLLSLQFKNTNSSIFFISLISFNIFLIKYSQELRVYSLMTLLIILSLYFLFKLFDREQNNFDYFCFTVFLFLAILSHPFSIIILISIICLSIIRKIFYQENLNKLNISLCIILALSIFYYFLYFINLNELTPWIPQINLKFFTNLFFSKFFGSRLLGLLHLVTLIYFIFIFRNDLITSKKFMVLILIIFFSYFLPLVFSLMFKPILIERYVMYLIIPILLIISFSIYNIEKIILRNSLIIIFILLTFSNFVTEDTFKQIFQNIEKKKPDFHSTLSKIEESDNKYFIIKKVINKTSGKIKFNSYIDLSLNKYVHKYILKNNFKLNLLSKHELDSLNINIFWIICYKDIDISKCEFPYNEDDYTIKESIDFKRINLKKIYLR